jgi:hypothetical protein
MRLDSMTFHPMPLDSMHVDVNRLAAGAAS